MNTHISVQPTQPTAAPTANLPIDPSNPLAWVILITLFLTRADKTIESTTQLIQSLTALLKTLTHSEPNEPPQSP